MINKKTITIIKLALKEDKYKDDITTNSLYTKNKKSGASVIAKSEGVLCGIEIFEKVFKIVDRKIVLNKKIVDGDRFNKGTTIVKLFGRINSILKAERTALNFLSHLSGIATKTNKIVKKTKGKVEILDTRKTTPGLRELEKYAVLTGGGTNHRKNLKDMVLIKENHLALYESIENAVKKIRNKHKNIFIEVEVKSLEEFKEALNLPVQRIMLDNFKLDEIKKAAKINNNKIQLEVSGGIDEENIDNLINTGVDYLSLGALTHSFNCSDFSLLIKNEE